MYFCDTYNWIELDTYEKVINRQTKYSYYYFKS